MNSPTDEEVFHPKSRIDWRNWLVENHESKSEIRLVVLHKKSDCQGIKYEEAIEEALCFGWIDSVANKYNDHSFLQRFSPRKPNSNWSQRNVDRITKLKSQGLMHKSGLLVLEHLVKKESG